MTYPPPASGPSFRPMSCPRCEGPMAAFQRAGIPVQYCQQCGGVFLDVSALDRIVAAELRAAPSAPGYRLTHHAPHGPAPTGPRPPGF
ncbi:zf-TFIIB domain-containing protein [Kitasatospora sp. NPDC057692]|uniref:TFIIB-type zinc ribbon-containing protein n=1 Tax=Kitasatospora sp. NPDC057692 TaxID=3346215 RepID=UPI0036C68C1F